MNLLLKEYRFSLYSFPQHVIIPWYNIYPKSVPKIVPLMHPRLLAKKSTQGLGFRQMPTSKVLKFSKWIEIWVLNYLGVNFLWRGRMKISALIQVISYCKEVFGKSSRWPLNIVTFSNFTDQKRKIFRSFEIFHGTTVASVFVRNVTKFLSNQIHSNPKLGTFLHTFIFYVRNLALKFIVGFLCLGLSLRSRSFL